MAGIPKKGANGMPEVSTGTRKVVLPPAAVPSTSSCGVHSEELEMIRESWEGGLEEWKKFQRVGDSYGEQGFGNRGGL